VQALNVAARLLQELRRRRLHIYTEWPASDTKEIERVIIHICRANLICTDEMGLRDAHYLGNESGGELGTNIPGSRSGGARTPGGAPGAWR
jgi:hypothetical protein